MLEIDALSVDQLCTCGHKARQAIRTVPHSFIASSPSSYGVQPWEYQCIGCGMLMSHPTQHYCQVSGGDRCPNSQK